MAKTIDEIFDEILTDSQAIAVEAVKNAAEKVQKKIVRESYRSLAKYYANYHPTVYVRTKSLHKSITPIFDDHSTKDGISIEVGVEYDSEKLEGIYSSGSKWHQSGDVWKKVKAFSTFSSDNGVPEPDWILNNFLEGKHGSIFIQDSESPNSLMENFLGKQLPKLIDTYVQDELWNAITRRL